MPTMKKIAFMVSFALLSSLDSMIAPPERSKGGRTSGAASNNAQQKSPRSTKKTTSISTKQTPTGSVTKKTETVENVSGSENNGQALYRLTEPVALIDQNEPEEPDDTKDILEKLALINNIDTHNLKATQDSSYTQLFNNFVGLKNFIVHNFSKTKFQKLCNELIDQIYPEDAVDSIDFGASALVVTPVKTGSSESVAAPAENVSQSIPMNNSPATGISFDFDTAPAQAEPAAPESQQDNSAPSQPE